MVPQILCSQEKGGPEESAYGRGLASAVCRAAELTGSLRSLRGVRCIRSDALCPVRILSMSI